LETQKPPSSDSSYQWIYAAALIVALVVFVFGSYLAQHRQGFELLAAGILSVVAVLVTWPIAAIHSGRAPG